MNILNMFLVDLKVRNLGKIIVILLVGILYFKYTWMCYTRLKLIKFYSNKLKFYVYNNTIKINK